MPSTRGSRLWMTSTFLGYRCISSFVSLQLRGGSGEGSEFHRSITHPSITHLSDKPLLDAPGLWPKPNPKTTTHCRRRYSVSKSGTAGAAPLVAVAGGSIATARRGAAVRGEVLGKGGSVSQYVMPRHQPRSVDPRSIPSGRNMHTNAAAPHKQTPQSHSVSPALPRAANGPEALRAEGVMKAWAVERASAATTPFKAVLLVLVRASMLQGRGSDDESAGCRGQRTALRCGGLLRERVLCGVGQGEVVGMFECSEASGMFGCADKTLWRRRRRQKNRVSSRVVTRPVSHQGPRAYAAGARRLGPTPQQPEQNGREAKGCSRPWRGTWGHTPRAARLPRPTHGN